ncbi:class I SAM-dependent methyltransferase [Mangrovicoccus algicola]|uniref:Class I SAM-dependent methyltransferase n=1 Tax=Mangrovicoccus algicola TaxID=2771008 RepID=A0A8J6Z613_9RHOB|nr:class I SAM-dependent methyltransferase [Mangrovicoccus algicola]MBE3637016.1 class I SAM-dependent methyltransferase [Mangrovicoccus algicola]
MNDLSRSFAPELLAPLPDGAGHGYLENDAWWLTARAALSVKCKFLGSEIRWAGSSVLQLACESGLVSDGLLRRGCDVTAVDTRAEMLRFARARSAAHGYRIGYDHVARLDALPHADGQFDIVLCDHVFDRDLEAAPLLAEIWRVLRPHGIVMFTCTRPGAMTALRLALFRGRAAPGLPRHMGRRAGMTPQRMRRLLRDARFEPRRFAGLAPRGIPGIGTLSYCTVDGRRPLWLGTAMKD